MQQRTATLAGLVQGFARHIRALKSPETKEATVRQNYIDPFWRLLGWDVGDAQQLGPAEVEVIVEPSVDTVDGDKLRSRRPDYLFRLNGFARFVVEAKKPVIDLDADRDAIFQAKQYAWNSTIPFAVLMSFEQFRLFDCTLKPIHREPKRGLVKEFVLNFEQYPAQWDVMLAIFGRDSVAGGSLEALRAQIRKVPAGRRLRTVDRMLFDLKGDEPVDKVFLAYLDRYRRQLARAIYRDNRHLFPQAGTLHGAARLTEAVQRLMDRLVFMRVCEDRGIAEWGGLRATLDGASDRADLYPALCSRFRELDGSYNGYLFKPHPVTEQLDVDGEVLADFIRNLYPPEGPWDFSAIGDDILGIVYERFLGNVVTVKQHQAEVEQKPEVRHAGGVYYTPRFVVDTIIRRVVGPKVKGKTPVEVLDVKILDPACGSGTFLVAAFRFLIDHCLATIRADPAKASVRATPKARKKRKDLAFKDHRGRWWLAPDFKANLLTSCIHGVDIDQQAVEVTVMSLYLKMLEGELPPNWQREWVENKLLPPLDNNIICGNSLIDHASYDAYAQKTKATLFGEDKDTAFRINRFDWESRTHGFGRLLDEQAVRERGRKGFDCIIGNPPYIRVQELNKWAPEECAFYKWKYKSAAKGNFDIYVVFVEKALSLLESEGILGFITPHKYWQAQYGEGLRTIIAGGEHLKAVVDFGDQQVFRGATTYTAIQVLSKRACAEPIDYAKILDLQDGETQCRAIEAGQVREDTRTFRASRAMAKESWSFVDADRAEFMTRLAEKGPRLADYAANVFVGLQTSADKVFILERRGLRYYSNQLNALVDLEPSLLHPLLKGSVHMKRWVPLDTQQVVLFPYCKQGGDFTLIDAETMQSGYPATLDYLLRCRDGLRTRERGTFEGERWYGYVYPKNLASMSKPKILTPSLARRGEYSVDRAGDLFFRASTFRVGR